MTDSQKQEVARCASFIRENFLQMPTAKSVAVYSLFFSGGTFADAEVINAALQQVKPNELYKRP